MSQSKKENCGNAKRGAVTPSQRDLSGAVEVHVAPSGTVYVSPGTAVLSPSEVYEIVRSRIHETKKR